MYTLHVLGRDRNPRRHQSFPRHNVMSADSRYDRRSHTRTAPQPDLSSTLQPLERVRKLRLVVESRLRRRLRSLGPKRLARGDFTKMSRSLTHLVGVNLPFLRVEVVDCHRTK